MRKKIRRTLSWLVVAAIFALPLMSLPGAVDMFLDIEGEISGESQDDKHRDEIDVLAWSWGMSQSGSFHVGGGGGERKASFQDISVTKWIDKASPVLMLYCANGDHFQKARLTVRKSGEKALEYLIIDMEKVLVSSITTGGSAGEDRLTEKVTLNFAKFSVQYVPQKPDGSADGLINMQWNIETGTEK